MLTVEITVFCIVSLAGIARAVASVGGALVIQVCWSLAWYLHVGTGSMKDAAGLVIFFNLSAPVQACLLRSHVYWPMVAVVAVPWVLFDIIGTQFLIAQDSSPWLKRTFGFALVGILLVEIAARRGEPPRAETSCAGDVIGRSDIVSSSCEQDCSAVAENPDISAAKQDYETSTLKSNTEVQRSVVETDVQAFDLRRRHSIMWALFLGIGGGLLNGLFSVPLPAYFMFVYYSGIAKDTWRASQVCVQMIAWPPKAYYFLVVKGQYDDHLLLLYAIAGISAIGALPLGNSIAAYVSQSAFKKLVFGITCVGACSMCLAGTVWAPWGGLAAFVAWLVGELWLS